MGFELTPNLQKLMEKVETAINKQLGRDTNYNNGNLDITERASIFAAKDVINNAVTDGEVSASEAENFASYFGLELSQTASARRASSSNDNNGGVIVDRSDGGVYINIDNSTSWSLTINISNSDAEMLQKFLNAFLQGMTNVMNDMKNELIEFLTKNNNNVFQMLNQLFTLLADNSNLQISTLKDILAKLEELGIKIDGSTAIIANLLNAQLQALKDNGFKMDVLINQVKTNNESQEKQNEIMTLIFDAIGNLANKFGNFSNEVIASFNHLFAMLENGQLKYDDIIKILKSIKEDTSENNDIGKAILVAMQKIDDHFTSYGEEIKALLKQIASKEVMVNVEGGNINVDIDVEAILQRLDNMAVKLSSIDNNTAENTKYSKAILDAINKLGVNITASLDTIIDRIGNDPVKLDELVALLNKINASINNLDENNEARNEKILNLISKLDLDVISGFNKLIDIGSKNNDLQVKTNTLIEELYNYIHNMPVGPGGGTVNIDVNGIIEAINNSGANISSKLDEVISIVKNLNSNFINLMNQVDSHFTSYGDEIKDLLKQIAAKEVVVNVDGGNINVDIDIEAILEKLDSMNTKLGLIEGNTAENTKTSKAILEAIAKLGLDVLDALNNLDITVTGGGGTGNVDLSEVIQAINDRGMDISGNLVRIFSLLTTMNANVVQGNKDVNMTIGQLKEVVQNIFANITSENNDTTRIIELLEILCDGLQNGTFTVKIDASGLCVCSCNNTGNNSHEGEIDDINDLVLNFEARTISNFDDDDVTATNKVKTDDTQSGDRWKEVLKGDKYGGLKGAHIIENNPDGTVNVYTLGGVMVRNHVHKE